MAYIQTKNRHGKKGKNIFCAKVAKIFEFNIETLNLNDVFKNFRKLFYMSFVIKAPVCFSRLTQSEYSSGKSNTSFNAGGIMLRNGIIRHNDFQAIA